MRSLGIAILGAGLVLDATRAHAADDETVARLARELQGHHRDQALTLLAPRVELGHLWFADAACAKQFAKPQTITGATRTTLVACLDELAATGTSPHHATGTGVILFHDGLALAVVVAEHQVTRIGFVDIDKTDAATPTVFRLASVIGRFAPTPAMVAAIDARTDHRATAIYKTCLDAKGKPTRTRLLATSGIVDFDKLAATTIADHASRPVAIGGKPAAVCEVIRFDHDTRPSAPPPATTRPQTVAPSVLEGSRTAGERWIAPDAKVKKQIVAAKRGSVSGAWRLCLDDKGAFASSTVLKATGFKDYDAQIERALRKWAFKPFLVNGTSVPVCTAITIQYSP